MANYWIKLYHEILDDPKMGTMPDRLWRRAIELFLMAGRMGTDGVLPNTNQLAWILRMNSADLQGDLDQLHSVGIIEPVPNGWLVVNFEKRQDAVPDAERKAQQRKRDKSRQYHGEVTKPSRSVTQINRVDTDIDTEEKREREHGADAPAPAGGSERVPNVDFELMTPEQAMKVKEIRVFQEATGRIPGRPTYRKVVETIRAHKFTVAQLRPYWETWNERGYRPTNLAWLTEWAVSGVIPGSAGQQTRAPAGGNGPEREIDRLIREAEEREKAINGT